MLTQFKNSRFGYISRLMALPLLFILVCAFAVKINKPKHTQHIISVKPITAIIDAGHGGSYDGTRNSNGVEEKNINLSIAKKIQELSKEYNVNVVLTRDNDAAVGNANSLKEDLQNRVNIATENNGDVFISLHVDADIKTESEKSGFEVFVSNKENNQNLSKSKILGSALIGELKNIYKTDEQLKQHDRGVVILDKNVAPSVIVECGYLTNKNDVDFITDPKNQEKIARNILEGIVKYNAFSNQSKSNNDSKTETHGYVYDSKKNILQFRKKMVIL